LHCLFSYYIKQLVPHFLVCSLPHHLKKEHWPKLKKKNPIYSFLLILFPATPGGSGTLFAERKQDSFDRVVRMGMSDSTYTWEITDQQGATRYGEWEKKEIEEK
jgi:hypothetical protein